VSAHHFFLPSVEGDTLVIEGDDARHAVRVLRIAPGETITISDGRGRVATATVTDPGTDAGTDAGRDLRAHVNERRDVASIRPALTVYQAIPKHGKLEQVVQTLTQCGAAAIVPFRAARSIAKWDTAKAAANAARLRIVAREAAMQSRRAHLLVVDDVIGIDQIPAGTIVLHEDASVRLSAVLPPETPPAIALAVGPEGGFSAAEIAALSDRGCPIATLGDLVLRTEVASVVAAAVTLTRYRALG
jgi:16S rRNA (uracil1498-N3)-methyltransferase